MLYHKLTIVFLAISSITSLPLQPQDEGDPPLSKKDLLESNEELSSEELEEYDYNLEVSNQEEILLKEETQADTLYMYEDTIPGVHMQEQPREEDVRNKEIISDKSSYVVEDDEKVGEILPRQDDKEIMSDYDYNGLEEPSFVVEDDRIVEDILTVKEKIEIASDYDYNDVDESEYVVVFDVPSEYKDDPEYRKFVEAAKLKDATKRSRMIVEFAMMSGMGLIGLTIMFGLISLANSCLRTRTSIGPQQVQITTTGGIIKQYTRVPVEIKNLLPSNVAYKQLYES